MTNDELEAVRARAEAATAGPWRVRTNRHPTTEGYRWGWVSPNTDQNISLPGISGMQWQEGIGQANAAFIAHARADIPALLDEVERLREQHEIVARIWKILGSPTYEELQGDTIYDVIEKRLACATRAEAHAERLAELLTRALWEIRSQSCDGVISASASPFHASTYDEPLEDDIEQALSTYNQRTET